MWHADLNSLLRKSLDGEATELCQLLATKDNVEQWVAKAAEMNFPSLKAHIEAEK
jgi:hypothetical protein